MNLESLSRAELIRATGFSGTAVDGWVRAGAPRLKSGRFSLPAVVRWLAEERGAGNTSSPERVRWLRARASREELRLRKEQGDLLPVDTVEREWCAMASAFRARMLAIPTKAAPLVVACNNIAQVVDTLTRHVHEALRELSTDDGEKPEAIKPAS